MAKVRREVVAITFKGPRFEDGGIDLAAVREVLTYGDMLTELAKELWRRKHPTRERLPRRFEDSLVLKFYQVSKTESCTLVLHREIDQDGTGNLFPDESDEATELWTDTVSAAEQDKPLPEAYPKHLLPSFGNCGKSLGNGESMKFKTLRTGKVASFNKVVRDRLVRLAEADYEDVVDVVGEIRSTDLDGLNYTIRLDNQDKVAGKFTPEQEELITDALRLHAQQRLRVKGRGLFDGTIRCLKRIVSTEDAQLENPVKSPPKEPGVPIWKAIAEIGQKVPDQDWAKVPPDLAKNLDHYLYGGPRK
jgi:hypothetical protein